MATVPDINVYVQEGHAKYGKIGGSVTEPLSLPASLYIYYQVTSPSGVIIKAIDSSNPGTTNDAEIPAGTGSHSALPDVDIPKTSDGLWEEGTYSVLIQSQVSSPLAGIFEADSFTFVLDLKNQASTGCVAKEGVLTFVADCHCLKLVISDDTDYSDVTLTDRTFTIDKPSTPTDLAPADVVNTGLVGNLATTITFAYSNVTYTASILSLYNYIVAVTGYPSGTVTVYESLSYTSSYKITCDHQLCKILSCINDFFTAAKVTASSVGGIQFLPVQTLDKWLTVQQLLVIYNAADKCNNTAIMESAYNDLKTATGCDCECDDASDKIVPLTALCA